MSWNRILVGVDGSTGSRAALGSAAAAARQSGAELLAVNCWRRPTAAGTSIVTGPVPLSVGPDPVAEARERLDEEVREVLGSDPRVKATKRVVEASPARELIDLSSEADRVVVGSRGRGGFAGLMLGSVSQQVASHARCDVLIAR